MSAEKQTTEEKLAQSSGNDTVKFSNQLEDEADELIRQAYGKDKEDDETDDKTGDKTEGTDNTEAGENTDDDDTEAGEEAEVKIDPEITQLLDKLDKSEKRIKDTRADHTRGRQELKDANAKSLELEDTVFKLKTQMEALQAAQSQKQEVKTEKAVEKTSGALADQIAAMEKVDPDLAATMKPIVESMFGKIDDLKEELAVEKQNAKDKAVDDANELHWSKIDKAHDGWESTMQTPEFAEYLQGLPARAKRLAMLDLKGGSAENVIEVFDEFKASQDGGEEETDKVKLAKGLSNPTNKKSKNINTGVKKMLYTRSQINNMTDAEYAKNEDAIDQAMANGQIQQI
jgi:hypothetical protein